MKSRKKQTVIAMIIAIAMSLAVIPFTAEPVHALSGAGSAGDPYRISTYDDLKEFADIVNGTHATAAQNTAACAVLVNDIKVPDGEIWIPAGSKSKPYTGDFDGRGHVIEGLKTAEVLNYDIGLFGCIAEGSTVSNVGLTGGSMYGKENVGGIAGYSIDSTIKNCYNTGNVYGEFGYAGGIVGYCQGSIMEDCHNSGPVSGSLDYENSDSFCVGGIAGLVDMNMSGTGSRITNCYNTGDISGYEDVAGIVGYNYGYDDNENFKCIVENCYNTGSIYAIDEDAGGIVGDNCYSTVTNCYNTGPIETFDGSEIIGCEDAGGIVGDNYYGMITNCYNTGNVTGPYAGGIAGENAYGTITNCYNTGNVSLIDNHYITLRAGGIAASNNNYEGIGKIENCYNAGTIIIGEEIAAKEYHAGGIVGRVQNTSIEKNCYYDINTSNVEGAVDGSDLPGDNVIGLTTKRMTGMDCTSYDSWENFFAIWRLTDSYPVFGPHDHELTYADAKEATCEENGHIAGYTCSTCGKHYSDDTGLALIPDAEWVIPGGTGHSWDEGRITKEATCTDKGEKTYSCTACKATKPEEIPATGHKYGEWTKLDANQHQRVCEHDAAHIEKEGHKWDEGKITKEATCTDKGEKTYTCTACKATKPEEIPATGHKWDEGKVTEPATEQAEGVKTYTCTVCKETKTETIPKLKPAVSGTLTARMTSKGRTGMSISWKEIKGAAGYDIFFAQCNHSGKKIVCKNVKNIEAGETLTWKKSGLKKGTPYKAYVKAYVYENGEKTYVKTSPMMHAYTGNGTKNYTNARSVKVNKTKLTLQNGASFKIKAKVNKVKKNRKLMSGSHVKTVRYMTSDSRIATVSSSGKVTARGEGTCRIYAYAHNGVSKQIKVVVK